MSDAPPVEAPAIDTSKLLTIVIAGVIVIVALRMIRTLKAQEEVAKLSASWIETERRKQQGEGFGDTGP